jgi:hypothetical protein
MKKGAIQDVTKNVLWRDACHRTNLETWGFGVSCIDVSDIDLPNVQVSPADYQREYNVEFLRDNQQVSGPRHISK